MKQNQEKIKIKDYRDVSNDMSWTMQRRVTKRRTKKRKVLVEQVNEYFTTRNGLLTVSPSNLRDPVLLEFNFFLTPQKYRIKKTEINSIDLSPYSDKILL